MAHPGKAAGSVGQPERATQNRVIALFRQELGYRYLGDWSDRLAEVHDRALELALTIDQTVKRVRPDGWRGIQTRENVIKGALLPLLGSDEAEVERMFLIIKAQGEY